MLIGRNILAMNVLKYFYKTVVVAFAICIAISDISAQRDKTFGLFCKCPRFSKGETKMQKPACKQGRNYDAKTRA